jgi:hypothetical protein
VRKCGEVEGRDGHGEVSVHQFITLFHYCYSLVYSTPIFLILFI